MKNLNTLLSIFLLFHTSSSRSENQSVIYKSKNLNLKLDFPVNWSHPISFNGFDSTNNEFRFKVKSTKKDRNIAQDYDFYLAGKKVSGGSITTKIGNPAKLSQVTDDPEKSTDSLESNISY